MSRLSRLINVFRTSKVDDDLDDELRFHIEARIQELMQQGLAREAAEAQALRQFGNPLRLRESSHDIKLLPWLESVFQDIRFGLRILRRDAVVTAAAVASLALAIGACMAAFSLVDALILRRLPVPEPERLIYLTFPTYEPESPLPLGETFNYPLFERLRGAAGAQVQLFGMSMQNKPRVVFPDAGGQREEVRTQYVSGDAFGILGVQPAIGRLLAASDDVTAGAHPVGVLSHTFWTRRFGGDRSVVGRSFEFRDRPFQIVGVAERQFTGIEPGRQVDLWVPNMMYDARAFTASYWNWFRILGRLKPGADPAQAQALLQMTFTNVRREQASRMFRPDAPRERLEQFINAPLAVPSAANGPSMLRRRLERPLWILAAVAAMVLLIAASNVANLLVARTEAREREMSLRASIGAGRGRLIQQVLIESGLLTSAACMLALLFAWIASPMVVTMLATAGNPVFLELRVDWRLLATLVAIGALTTMLFGLAPAWRASRVAPIGVLREGAGRLSSRIGILRPLVVVQVSFSLVLLFVAGLLLLSFARLTRVNLGFAKQNVLLAAIESRELRDPEQTRVVALQLLDRVRQLPAVGGASLSAWPLFSGGGWTASVRLPGRPADEFQSTILQVSPGFFETMRIGLVDGRRFESLDTEPATPSAVVVNEAFARRYFGSQRAVGRVFDRLSDNRTIRQEIIGIAADAKYNDPRLPAPPTVYLPHRGLGTLQVRTVGDPLAMASTIGNEVRAVHPSLGVTEFSLQSTLVENTLVRERLLALLSGFFAAVGLLLAAIGLYGVLSYSVVRRTREIGIRLALGAQPMMVVRSVLADVALVTVLGVAAGVAGGLFFSRFLRTLLFEVEPLDVSSLALPVGALLVVTLAAAFFPARRAARVDPMVALRYE